MTEPFYVIQKKRDGILDVGIMAVVVTFLRVPITHEEVLLYLSDIETLYAKQRPFLIEYDATRLQTAPSKAIMRHLADDMKEKEIQTKKLVVACAIVLDTKNPIGALIHTLVKSILLIRKPVCPLNFFGSVKEAESYLATFHPKQS